MTAGVEKNVIGHSETLTVGVSCTGGKKRLLDRMQLESKKKRKVAAYDSA
jgi:hypothetical protein